MANLTAEKASAWEAAGRRSAPVAGAGGAIVVTGDDAEAAAFVALGMGREQARRRRVAVADLVGELPPIESLAPGGVRHGVSDNVLYGVSLSRIAHPVDAARNLFVLPSGDAPLDHDTILRSERWRRLGVSFAEADALLLLIARSDSPGLDALVQATAGAVVVGHTARPIPGPVLAWVEAPQAIHMPAPAADTAGERVPEVDVSQPTVRNITPIVGLAPVNRSLARHLELPWRLPRSAYWVAGAAAAVLLLALALRSLDRAQAENNLARRGKRVAPAAATPVSGGTPDAGVATPPPLPPAPDTAIQRYSVQLASFTSLSGANTRLDQQERRGMPAATFSPVVLPDGGRFYYLRVGAYRRWASADSMLRALRRQGVLGRGEGTIVKTPYAVLVDRGMMLETARSLASGYRAKGLPVYVVPQGDGTGALYAGSFAAPEQAGFLLATFRANGYQPSVVLRTGR